MSEHTVTEKLNSFAEACHGFNGHLVDYYFENTFEKSDELVAWMPMPEITNGD